MSHRTTTTVRLGAMASPNRPGVDLAQRATLVANIAASVNKKQCPFCPYDLEERDGELVCPNCEPPKRRREASRG